MKRAEDKFRDQYQKKSDENAKVLSNFFRCLTMLEKTLERLARQRCNFNVKGITTDKWKSLTNALKSVFYKVWIGFCHLHFLKKLSKALASCPKETNRSWKVIW